MSAIRTSVHTAPVTQWTRQEAKPLVRGQLVRDEAQSAWQELRVAAQGHQLPCAAVPDQHFPDEHDDKRTARAVELCATCPVLAECRTFALANQEQHGVWGGLTERARRKLWRRQQRQRDRDRDVAA